MYPLCYFSLLANHYGEKAETLLYPLCLNFMRLNSGFRALGPFLHHAILERTYQSRQNIGPASPMNSGALVAYRT
jgi:hypothetical protein